MKIIEEGEGWHMEVKCTGAGNGNCGCGARLLIDKDDVYLTHIYDYTGDHEICYTIKCIQCGEETDIPEKDIPSGIRHKLLDRYRNSMTNGRTK